MKVSHKQLNGRKEEQMKIAVTYENGQVFQHFGHTEAFKLYGGVTGSADEAVKALLCGTLDFNPAVHCSHHDGEHDHGTAHTCGEHGCRHMDVK